MSVIEVGVVNLKKRDSNGGSFGNRTLVRLVTLGELTFHPDGQLPQHLCRIEEELDLVPHHQSTNRRC